MIALFKLFFRIVDHFFLFEDNLRSFFCLHVGSFSGQWKYGGRHTACCYQMPRLELEGEAWRRMRGVKAPAPLCGIGLVQHPWQTPLVVCRSVVCLAVVLAPGVPRADSPSPTPGCVRIPCPNSSSQSDAATCARLVRKKVLKGYDIVITMDTVLHKTKVVRMHGCMQHRGAFGSAWEGSSSNGSCRRGTSRLLWFLVHRRKLLKGPPAVSGFVFSGTCTPRPIDIFHSLAIPSATKKNQHFI